MLPSLGQQQNTHNYSPTLHLSTEASLALKSPATLHTLASARILRITNREERLHPRRQCHCGVSTSTSIREQCLSRSHTDRPSSRARSTTRPQTRPSTSEGGPLCPTNIGKWPTLTSLHTTKKKVCDGLLALVTERVG
jgi:hypothetical protein